MTVILKVSRLYAPMEFEHDTVRDAAQFALDSLESGKAWPLEIIQNDKTVWQNTGPFGDGNDKLLDLLK